MHRETKRGRLSTKIRIVRLKNRQEALLATFVGFIDRSTIRRSNLSRRKTRRHHFCGGCISQ